MLSPPSRSRCLMLAAIPILVIGCDALQNPVETADVTPPSFSRGNSPSASGVVLLGVTGTAWAINSRGQVVGLDAGRQPYRSFVWNRGALTDLGTLGPSDVSASDINARGQIVGTTENARGQVRAFLWENGKMRELGAPPGAVAVYGDAINDAGQIVVSTNPLDSYLWKDGQWTRLSPVPGDVVFSPRSISNAGVVAGYSMDERNRVQPAVWKNGVTTALPTFGGMTGVATGVNSKEQIVGYALDRAGRIRAALWQAGTVIDLGTLGGDWAIANDINNRGQIVGISRTGDGAQHAFLWQDDVLVDLGPGTATAINERGDVVGRYSDQAALWPKH